MHRNNLLLQILYDRIRRMSIAAVGLFIYSFGFYLQLLISIGVSPWHALNQGLSQILGITFGQVSILVSVAVVIADLLLREPIGLGTLLDAFLIGFGADFFLALDLFPYQSGVIPSVIILFFSLVISCIGSRIYIGTGLSCGPRDAMVIAIGRRIPKLSIGTIVVLVNLIVAVIGFLLGGSVGVGTLINMFCYGIVMDLVYRLLRFEPRDIRQEGLTQTVQAFASAAKSR